MGCDLKTLTVKFYTLLSANRMSRINKQETLQASIMILGHFFSSLVPLHLFYICLSSSVCLHLFIFICLPSSVCFHLFVFICSFSFVCLHPFLFICSSSSVPHYSFLFIHSFSSIPLIPYSSFIFFICSSSFVPLHLILFFFSSSVSLPSISVPPFLFIPFFSHSSSAI